MQLVWSIITDITQIITSFIIILEEAVELWKLLLLHIDVRNNFSVCGWSYFH